MGNSDVVGGYNLRKEFGEKWYEPKGLVLRPLFIVDEFNTTLVIERNSEVKLKLQFFNDINNILKHETLCASLSGYAIFDFDLKDLRPGNDMKTHAALLSKFQYTIIELADEERCIDEAKRKLTRITSAIRKHINFNIPVKSVVFFPCRTRLPSSFVCPNNSVLYKDELRKLLENFLKQPALSIEDTSNVKTTLAEMIRMCFFAQHHPKTVEEAASRAAQRFFMQSPGEKISEFSQIDFNSIKLTDFQQHIKNDLLAGNTLVWGGYGIGKSVAIVAAIAESIKLYRSVKQRNREQGNFKILLISAQGLLGDIDLKLSPFILMIEKWITDVCEDLACAEVLQVINYIHFLDRSIDFAIQSKVDNVKEIIFTSYLLKKTDLKLIIENSWGFKNFDIIVLEETHALDSNVISYFVAGFQKAVRTKIKDKIAKVWITTNARRLDITLPDFAISPKSHNKSKNMRNAPAVAKLAKAVNTVIGPERYPSTAMPLSPIKCLINVTYQYDYNEKERFRKIVELADRWKHCLPKSSILFIDCEQSTLYEELHTASIPLKMYSDSYKTGESLFLRHSDPIEAIVAGAEWHVLIVHIGINTLNSIRMTELFNKRIISRATAKIFIFSDYEIRDEEEFNANEEPLSNFTDENVEESDTEPLHDSYNYFSDDIKIADGTGYSYISENFGNKNEPIGGFANLLENMKAVHEEFPSDEKLSHYNGYDFIQVRNLDRSLRAVSQNIYLVHGIEKSFIVHLNSDTEDEVLECQILLERVWKVQLPAFCDSRLVSPSQIDNLIGVSKLLYLLKPKVFSSMTNDIGGVMTVGEEDVNKFSKNGKLIGFLWDVKIKVLKSQLTDLLAGNHSQY